MEGLRRDWDHGSPWGRLLRRRARLNEALQQAARLAPPDAVAAHLPPETWEYELLPQLMFGHETTAATFAWCFALLYPEARRRIAEGDQAFTLAYVQMHAPVSAGGPVDASGHPRSAPRPSLPGSWPGGNARHPPGYTNTAGPSPTACVPSAFWSKHDPHSYCPFGVGEHICPGKPMALRQLVMMLQTVLQNFRIGPIEGYRAPGPVRQLFLVSPSQGTPVVRRA